MSQSQIENLDVLPDNWVWTTIGDIADTTRQRTNPQNYPNLKFIGMENVEAHTMRLLGTVPASEMVSNAEHFYSGDVLYGRMRPYLNKVYQPDFEGLCSGEFIIFRRTPEIDNSYLQYFLNSWAFVSFTSHLTEGDRPRISFEQMADYPFPLAPLAEQQRIVAAIETHFTRLDTAVATLHRLQANLKRYRAAVLKAACAGRLVAQDPTDEPATQLLARILAERRSKWQAANPGKKYQEPLSPYTSDLPELPESWVWTQFTAIISEGPQNGLYLPRDAYGDGIPILRIDDYQNGSSRVSGQLRLVNANTDQVEKYSLREDDLVINRVNSMTHLGKCLLVMKRNLPAIFESNMMRLKVADGISTPYIQFYLQSVLGKKQLIKNSKWAVNQASINQEDVGSTIIPLPPLDEQVRIVAEVERRLSVIDQHEKAIRANLARAARLRQSILKRAFTGRLVPQDPTDEPASLLLDRIRAQRSSQAKTRKT